MTEERRFIDMPERIHVVDIGVSDVLSADQALDGQRLALLERAPSDEALDALRAAAKDGGPIDLYVYHSRIEAPS